MSERPTRPLTPRVHRVRLLTRGAGVTSAPRDRAIGRFVVRVPVEVNVVRLYTKSPGSHQLRKNAAAELAHLLAAGWEEKSRRAGADHVVLRLERPRPAKASLPTASGPGRPRR